MWTADGPILVPLPDFQPQPSNGARCQLAMPRGPTYLNLVLLFLAGATALTKAQISAQVANIRITVNSRVKFELTGAQAVVREEFYRTGSVAPGNNGILELTFHRPWMQTENESASGFSNQDGPAFGTQGLSTFNAEVQMAASSVTADTLRAYARQTGPEPLGRHITVLKYLSSFGSTGRQRITDLPRGLDATANAMQLYALHIEKPGSSTITELEIVAEKSRVLGPVTESVLHSQLIDAGRTVQTGWTHIDFCARNRHQDALTMNMNELDLYITWATAAPGAFSIIMEMVETMPIQAVGN